MTAMFLWFKSEGSKPADSLPSKAARDYLRLRVTGKTVTIRRIIPYRNRRTVAELLVDGSNFQQQLVASCHAEIYRKYAHQCPWTR